MTLRLSDEEEHALDELAQASGTSKQQVIRMAILEQRRRMKIEQRIDAVVDDVMVRDAELLHRLSQ